MSWFGGGQFRTGSRLPEGFGDAQGGITWIGPVVGLATLAAFVTKYVVLSQAAQVAMAATHEDWARMAHGLVFYAPTVLVLALLIGRYKGIKQCDGVFTLYTFAWMVSGLGGLVMILAFFALNPANPVLFVQRTGVLVGGLGVLLEGLLLSAYVRFGPEPDQKFFED